MNSSQTSQTSQTSQSTLTREMLENAVFQQLFLGEKRIQGKNPEHEMQLTGVESLLNEFISELEANLKLIEKLDIHGFIKKFEIAFNIDLKHPYKRIMSNLEAMGGLDQLKEQETVIIYIVLTKIVEAIREFAYKKYGKQRIEEIFSETHKQSLSKHQEEKIQHLAATNNPNISLLYNLSFIMLLATKYGSKQFKITCKRLITLRINRIIKKIE